MFQEPRAHKVQHTRTPLTDADELLAEVRGSTQWRLSGRPLSSVWSKERRRIKKAAIDRGVLEVEQRKQVDRKWQAATDAKAVNYTVPFLLPLRMMSSSCFWHFQREPVAGVVGASVREYWRELVHP